MAVHTLSIKTPDGLAFVQGDFDDVALTLSNVQYQNEESFPVTLTVVDQTKQQTVVNKTAAPSTPLTSVSGTVNVGTDGYYISLSY